MKRTKPGRTITPGSRPLRGLARDEVLARLEAAFLERDGIA
jgi:hypothetical protein